MGSSARTVNSYALSGNAATLTLASAVSGTDTVTVAYTNPGGNNAKLADLAGNALASFTAKSVGNSTGAPQVVAASSGYYDAANLTTPLTGPVSATDDIYVKVTFTENVNQTIGNGAGARPEISYKIGKAGEQQFHIVAHTATLATGDCQADAATPADVYECRYTVKSGDTGNFDFRVGTGTQDSGGTALAAKYTHTAKILTDTTKPSVTAASTGYYDSAALNTPLTGPVKAATDIYMKVTFSENLAHTTNDSPNGRPAMGYQIGTAAGSFDIVANTANLATGDCRPDAAPPADVYQCLYTTGSTDSGKFELLIDRRVEDEAGNTLGTVYRHAAGIQIDTTAPTYSSASVTGATLTVTFSENLDTDSTAKAANSAWDVQVTPSGGSEAARSVSSYSVTGKTAVLTLASAVVGTDTVTVAYNQPSGTDPKLADLAGNLVANISAQSVTVGASGPSVIQASSGYFENAALTTPRTGAVKAGADIYVKVTFDKNVSHVTSDLAAARPELRYKIGTATAQRFHVVAHGTTLQSGDCRPDAATPADVYECLYTPVSADSGNFDFRVGTGTTDTDSNALAAAYTHTAKILIDNTAPTVSFSPGNGGYTNNASATITLTFSEPVFANDSATAFTDSGAAGIVTLKRTSAAGPNIGFSAAVTTTGSDANKKITVTPSSNLSEGKVYVAVSNAHYDAAGNQGTASNATFTVDTTAPTVVTASTGYYSDAAATKAVTKAKFGDAVYIKITFSEDMSIPSNGSGNRFVMRHTNLDGTLDYHNGGVYMALDQQDYFALLVRLIQCEQCHHLPHRRGRWHRPFHPRRLERRRRIPHL